MTIKDALTRIGLSMVKNIVTDIALRDKFSSKDKELNSYLFQLFVRAIETSYLVYKLVERNRKLGINPDEAYLSGILFNLGQLPVVSYFEQHEYSSIEDVQFHADDLRSRVNEILMRKWEVSQKIVSAVCRSDKQMDGRDLGDLLLIVDAYLKNDTILANTFPPVALELWKDIDENYETDVIGIECLKLILTR